MIGFGRCGYIGRRSWKDRVIWLLFVRPYEEVGVFGGQKSGEPATGDGWVIEACVLLHAGTTGSSSFVLST